MDNQQTVSPQNQDYQNNQEPLPPQSSDTAHSSTSSMPMPPTTSTQSGFSPEQQPTPVFNPSQVAPTESVQSYASQPQMMQPIPMQMNSKKSPMKMIAIALLVVFVLLAAGYLLITHNNKAAKLATKAVVNNTQPNSGTTTSNSSSIANEESIAFGSTATDGTFQVKLVGTTLSPKVTGDLADSGTQYLEADFSITSVANKNNYAFNMHYLPSTVPAGDKMGDIELTPADSSLPKNPLTFSSMKSKSVQITGKKSTQAYTLPIDGSVKTVQAYTLFEIKAGDTGDIVWQGLDNGNYHFLTK